MRNLKSLAAMLLVVCACVACSNNDDPDTTQAKAVAGTYAGYSIGTSKMFTDYLMGAQAATTITANEDGTINLVYKSGSGDFKLDNLTVSAGKFSGGGNVNLAMGTGSGSSYAYTLEGSVDNAKVLTLKATIPAVMSGLEVNFIQGETPIAYYVANTYQYQSTLDISVMGTSYGSTDQGKAIIKRAGTGTGVDITINGFDKMDNSNPAMVLGNFTIKEVALAAGADGTYTLTSGAFKAVDSNNKEITGESLTGTVAANGIATITVVFKPGSMPMAITASFTGNHTKL